MGRKQVDRPILDMGGVGVVWVWRLVGMLGAVGLGRGGGLMGEDCKDGTLEGSSVT